MIHSSLLPDITVPDTLLTPFVLQHAQRLSSEPALVEGSTGRSLTYAEFSKQVKALAGGLQQRGFGKGDVLAIMAPNVPEYAVAFHGTAWAGSTVTTVNPTYTAHEVKHQLKDSGAKLLVTVSMFLSVAQEAVEGTDVEEIFTIDPSDVASLSSLAGEAIRRSGRSLS